LWLPARELVPLPLLRFYALCATPCASVQTRRDPDGLVSHAPSLPFPRLPLSPAGFLEAQDAALLGILSCFGDMHPPPNSAGARDVGDVYEELLAVGGCLHAGGAPEAPPACNPAAATSVAFAHAAGRGADAVAPAPCEVAAVGVAAASFSRRAGSSTADCPAFAARTSAGAGTLLTSPAVPCANDAAAVGSGSAANVGATPGSVAAATGPAFDAATLPVGGALSATGASPIVEYGCAPAAGSTPSPTVGAPPLLAGGPSAPVTSSAAAAPATTGTTAAAGAGRGSMLSPLSAVPSGGCPDMRSGQKAFSPSLPPCPAACGCTPPPLPPGSVFHFIGAVLLVRSDGGGVLLFYCVCVCVLAVHASRSTACFVPACGCVW
jgi:hypothetical protein